MLNGFRQKGLSLVELMVGLLVGLIVVGGATAMYVTNMSGQTNALRAAKLNQDLRATMSVMVADIRRAGVWAGSITGAGTAAPLPHAYSGTTTTLTVLNNGTCIMYSYDLDSSGGNIDPTELFGFRLNGDVVEMLNSAINTSTDTSDCSIPDWSDMTDNNTVVIDSLAFSTTGSQCFNATTDLSWQVTAAGSTSAACSAPPGGIAMNGGAAYIAPVSGDVALELRQITITLSGHHRSDATISSTITETVHIPNNRLFQVP